MAASCLPLVKELLNINCCNICVLRFTNEKSLNAYKNADQNIKKLLGETGEDIDEPISKAKKSNPCTTCLGLLQNYASYINKVLSEVKTANFDAAEVCFALSLPISLMLRNYSVWLHVSEIFRDYYISSRLYSNYEISYGDLKADSYVVSIKEAWKILVAPELADAVNKTLNNGVDSQFHVNLNFDYSGDGEETSCMGNMHPEIFSDRGTQRRKYHNEVFTRKSVEQALEKTSYDLFAAHSNIPPKIPSSFVTCSSVTCCHDSIYVAGRYNKFSRALSQTPWVINGERRMESSVEELISEPVAKAIPSDSIRFTSSGREDVDVRTLGRGRPFVLDVVNPRITQLIPKQLYQIQESINSSSKLIKVRDLQLVKKDELVHIKTGERNKTKTYDCLCIVRGQAKRETLESNICDLNKMEAFVIQQKTPVRVLHRRPLAVRPRTVHWLKCQLGATEGEHTYFTIRVKVEAGTYIKELVHGDFGRTKPSISSFLGLEADILALDVEEVDLDWPPPIISI